MLALLLAGLAPFSAVDASGEVRVVIAPGAEAKVDAPAGVSIAVKDGVLVVSNPEAGAVPPVVTVAVPTLTAVAGHGAATLAVQVVDGKLLDVTLTDAARATLEGKVASLRIAATGTARVDAAKLQAQAARVELSRAARATVTAIASLDADLSGASRCTAKVKPKRVEQKIAGAARLELPER